ncbi:transcription initiation factor TFIID subunit [Planoprotostelium fungivorum]|uniref:Transcription initiation factor TFIID subunit 13 n=1 Tax=Planoprotostelium fungivorum TaxID=1890364 RepID=A0A2P6NHC7_9EUKA|nr:transcription initiation factor TFIID subunit [Planoprotostelium fungivorum]
MNTSSLGGLNLNLGRGIPIKTTINNAIPNFSNNMEPPKRKRKVRHIMFGFGDVKNPLPESVELVDEIVSEYIISMATELKKDKIQTEDILFHIRKDRKKFNRVKELLTMHEELKRAKKAFEMTDDPDAEDDNRGEDGDDDV